MSEDTTPAAPAETAATGDGPKPDPEAKPTAKVPDADYVKSLRKEAADTRKALQEAQSRLQEIEDRDKTESEKLASRAAESERRAVEAEARILRLEVAAERGFTAQAVALLAGNTREEIEASAEALAAVLKDNERPTPGFDGGARKTPDEQRKPELAHNDWLLQALGRTPS